MIFASAQRRNDRFESSWRLWVLEALDLVTGAQLESGHGKQLKPLILTIPKKYKTISSRGMSPPSKGSPSQTQEGKHILNKENEMNNLLKREPLYL